MFCHTINRARTALILLIALSLFFSCSDNPTGPDSKPAPNPAAQLECDIMEGGPTAGAAPYSLQLSAGATGGVAPYSYYWDFADGTSAATQSCTHRFANPGVYNVTLRVSDATTSVCTHQCTVTVTDTSSQAMPDLRPAGPLTISPGSLSAGDTVTVASLGINNAGQAASASFRVGIYLSSDTIASPGTASDITLIEQEFAQGLSAGQTLPLGEKRLVVPGATPAGSYYLIVMVDCRRVVAESNESNNSVYSSLSVTAVSGLPDLQVQVSSPMFTPSTVVAGGQAYLNTISVRNAGAGEAGATRAGLYLSVDAAITTGDVLLATRSVPALRPGQLHSYGDTLITVPVGLTAGQYYLGVIVDDLSRVTESNENNNVAFSVLTVSTAPAALRCMATASPTSGYAPLTVQFSPNVSGGRAPYTYRWQFGDGYTSALANPTHTFQSAGTYSVMLTVTDADQRTAGSMVPVTANAAPSLTAYAGGTPTSGIAPLTVEFSGSASSGVGPYSYSWTFGDGSSATGPVVTHTYASAGTYNAILTVTDSQARTARDTVTISVSAPVMPLTCNLSATPTSGSAPLTVSFTGSASGGLGGYSYQLRFGDGTSTPAASAAHTYTSAGDFWAVLTVTDGQAHTAKDSVRISVASGGTVSAPSNLRVTMSGGQILLNWADNATNETGYEIHASLTITFSPYDTFNAAANATSYSFAQYTPGVTYYFRVRAVSGATYSAFSNTASITTSNTIASFATAANSVASASNNNATANTVFRDGQVFVGCVFTNYFEWTDIFNQLGVFRFDNLQPMISGRSIASAVLRLYPSSYPIQNDTYYWVAALAGVWNPNTLTYNNTPNWYTGGQSSVRPPVSTVVPVEFNITTIVRNWANGTFTNNGLIIYDQAALNPWPSYNIDRTTQFESEDNYSHPDRRPQIIVTFQ